jgi:hypothetical protein
MDTIHKFFDKYYALLATLMVAVEFVANLGIIQRVACEYHNIIL